MSAYRINIPTDSQIGQARCGVESLTDLASI